MGILDEAIREHLELKRQHGAEEADLKELEDDAFGSPSRPESPADDLEPATTVLPAEQGSPESTAQEPFSEPSPQSSDFGDNPFITEEPRVGTGSDEAETVMEHAVVPPVERPAADKPPEPEPKAPEAEGSPKPEPRAEDDDSGDASDALQRERLALADHPTEHYDVEQALAEEEEARRAAAAVPEPEPELEKSLAEEPEAEAESPAPPAETVERVEQAGETEATEESAEIEPFDEGSLSDELDRALDGPGDSTSPPPGPEAEEARASENEGHDEAEEVDDEDVSVEAPDDDRDDRPEGEDVLEETPDFLQDTPEHDRLWFEQKPPKDFDFDD